MPTVNQSGILNETSGIVATFLAGFRGWTRHFGRCSHDFGPFAWLEIANLEIYWTAATCRRPKADRRGTAKPCGGILSPVPWGCRGIKKDGGAFKAPPIPNEPRSGE